MTIANKGDGLDSLLRVRCPVADFAEKHVTDRGEGGYAMREVKAVAVPPGAVVTLAPRGAHLMLLHTKQALQPGETFTYEYTADEVAVAMYHPHFHSQVGMPNGMFGSIFVGQVPIPRGITVGDEVLPADLQVAQEFPMVLNDSGVIGYSLNGKSFPATAPIVAKTGDWVLFHYFNEGSQSHPMHLHQFDQIVLAKDGYPLDAPYVADVVNVAPGERYSVLVQLDKPGAWVWHCHILPHVEDENGMFGMVTAVIVE